MDGIIGSFDWESCSECEYGGPGGGCSVNDDTFRDELEHDGDSIRCGCFIKDATSGEGE